MFPLLSSVAIPMHNSNVNGLTLLQEVNHEHSLTVPENKGYHLPTDAASLNFLGG